MPSKEYALIMARYNLWQNENILTAASGLSVDERRQDRGAFFGSIERTLSHLFWADMLWLGRFTGSALLGGSIAESVDLIGDWQAYCIERRVFDQRILHWAQEVRPDWFTGEITWVSGAIGRQITRPNAELVIQMFNHQTHHRGQIHAMLTAAGARPSDTDVPFMPERFRDL